MGAEWTADDILGTNCARLRRAAGLSQRELARDMSAVGFAWERDTISQIETARRRLGFDELAALAAYFELPPRALLSPPAELLFGRVAFGQGVIDSKTWSSLWAEWDFSEGPAPKHYRDAVDAIFHAVRRPWALIWRRKKGHPGRAYAQAREELLSQRSKYPGPIFLADRPDGVDMPMAPWSQWVGVTIRLEPGVPYVARDEVEAEALDDLVERSEGHVRRITRAQAHYLREKLGQEKGTK